MNVRNVLNSATVTANAVLATLPASVDNLSMRFWKSTTAAHAQKGTVKALTTTAAARLVIIPISLYRNKPLGKAPFIKGASYTPAGRKFLYVQLVANAFTVAIGAYELRRQSREVQQNTSLQDDLR